MSKHKEFWTILWDVVKFILTLGISHINKRKEKISADSSSLDETISQLKAQKELYSQLLKSNVSKNENE